MADPRTSPSTASAAATSPPSSGSSASNGAARHAGARPAQDPVPAGGDAPAQTHPALSHEQGERGSLTVADTVLVTIAQRAALEVDGVAPADATTGRLGKVLGRGYPDADVEHAGSRAGVTLEIATVWPHPAAGVAAAVRGTVTRRLRELAAVEADTVTVHVAAVVQPPPARDEERVR